MQRRPRRDSQDVKRKMRELTNGQEKKPFIEGDLTIAIGEKP